MLLAATLFVITNAADVTVAVYETRAVGAPFALEATLLNLSETHVHFADGSGPAVASIKRPLNIDPRPQPGDRIRLGGDIRIGENTGRVYADCQNVARVSRGTPPVPRVVTAAEFLGGKCDFALVQVAGEVNDIVLDNADTNFLFLALHDATGSVFIPQRRTDPRFLSCNIEVGSHVTVTGICDPAPYTTKRRIGRIFDPVTHITRTGKSDVDRFDVPEVGDFWRTQPEELATFGRMKAVGEVLAVWSDNQVLLKTESDIIVNAELSGGTPPHVGDSVEIAGLPCTDLYQVFLVRAVWRTVPRPVARTGAAPAKETSIRSLFRDDRRQRHFNCHAHGQLLTVRGTVRNLAANDADVGFDLEDDGFTLRIDVSARPELMAHVSVGCLLDVTGIGVMKTEKWNPAVTIPHIKGFRIVPRGQGDIVILSRPSWWTEPRLLYALLVLTGALVLVIIWNILLRRLAERRGRALAKAAVAAVESEMKVRERTRLAVELHDSISQNLTGVSMEISAASRLNDGDPDTRRRHLDIAIRSLKSCREELKNCLWDLRNLTFDEPSVEEAIRTTLKPHLGATSVSIRFPVPREILSDNTAHAFLSIIRELSVNAIRHGRATTLWIAGSIDNGKLLFSVKDDGCGFDPDACPGMEEGHFGLEGIRERIREFGGTFTMKSSAAKGSKATIAIPIPSKTLKEISA